MHQLVGKIDAISFGAPGVTLEVGEKRRVQLRSSAALRDEMRKYWGELVVVAADGFVDAGGEFSEGRALGFEPVPLVADPLKNFEESFGKFADLSDEAREAIGAEPSPKRSRKSKTRGSKGPD